ncbi:MAG: methylated-DNA--[protein]-cysteine S-methyltransferase [Puniceicoccales bacterium]|nr:methylated-DNA--[protein]-cysteine S-methyltransferase [Puniceicoccales bacterium]
MKINFHNLGGLPDFVRVTRVLDEALGEVVFGWSGEALCLCCLGENALDALRERADRWEVPVLCDGVGVSDKPSRAALKAFKINRPEAFPQLLLIGSPFQQKVWRQLIHIRSGETTCYSGIAHDIGVRCYRCVGTAVGQNPIALFVPCHRVIGRDGALCGFAYGIPLKEKLLAFEHSTKHRHGRRRG